MLTASAGLITRALSGGFVKTFAGLGLPGVTDGSEWYFYCSSRAALASVASMTLTQAKAFVAIATSASTQAISYPKCIRVFQNQSVLCLPIWHCFMLAELVSS